MTNNTNKPKPATAARVARRCQRIRTQGAAVRLWDWIDYQAEPEPLWAIMAAVVPWAFAEPGNVNSLWAPDRGGPFRPGPPPLPNRAEPPALPLAMAAPFDCPRTCPRFERVDVCRFNALFRLIGGRVRVNSHTVTVDVEYTNAPHWPPPWWPWGGAGSAMAGIDYLAKTRKPATVSRCQVGQKRLF